MAEPTLRQLRYFVTLADTLHFGDAAAICGVSQPNLSAQIRELEKTLGAQLVERTPRQTILTRAGTRVLERARAVVRDVDDLVDLTRSSGDPFAGRLRLGVIPTIAPYVLPRVLPAVRAAHPALELHLTEDFTDRLIPRLGNGELDLLLLALPVDQAGLEAVSLVDEPFVLVTPRSHPLAAVDEVDAADFEPADLLLLQEGHCLRDQTLKICRANPGKRPVVEGTSLTTLVQMVANGLGVTLLPMMAINVDMPADEVAVRPFSHPQPGRTLGLVWRSASVHAESYRRLASSLQPQIAALLDEAAGRTVLTAAR